MNWNTLNFRNVRTEFCETFSLHFAPLIIIEDFEYNSVLAQNKSLT